MVNRLYSVLLVVVLLMVLLLPGAASASSSPRSLNAPDAPLVLTWTQRNASGFGDKNNAAVSALEVFSGQLYAGTTNDLGAQLWRTSDGSNWSPLTLPGFRSYGHGVLFDLITFNGKLYAADGAWPVLGTTGEIWRSGDGTTWGRVTGAWEANPNNAGVSNFAVFNSMLYATTYNPVDGIEVFRSATGNPNDWARVANASFGLNSAYGVATGLTVFNNSLYVALEGQKGGPGARIYRTSDGTTWTPANVPGFGNPNNYGSGGFAVHGGLLYVGTRNDVTGGQIWRSADGTTWTKVGTSGFGKPLNYKIEGMVSVLGTLFAFSDNDTTGTEVWSSVDGLNWVQSNIPGFGSANNKAVALWSNGSGLLSSQLYLGTFNQQVGGQVWAATPPVIQPPPPPLGTHLYLPYITGG